MLEPLVTARHNLNHVPAATSTGIASGTKVKNTIGVQKLRLIKTGHKTIGKNKRPRRKCGRGFGLESFSIDLNKIDLKISVDTLIRIELVTKKLNTDIGQLDVEVSGKIEVLETGLGGACGERLNNLTAKDQIELFPTLNTSGANSDFAAATASVTATAIGELKEAIGVKGFALPKAWLNAISIQESTRRKYTGVFGLKSSTIDHDCVNNQIAVKAGIRIKEVIQELDANIISGDRLGSLEKEGLKVSRISAGICSESLDGLTVDLEVKQFETPGTGSDNFDRRQHHAFFELFDR